jgi:hypothetical protein
MKNKEEEQWGKNKKSLSSRFKNKLDASLKKQIQWKTGNLTAGVTRNENQHKN